MIEMIERAGWFLAIFGLFFVGPVAIGQQMRAMLHDRGYSLSWFDALFAVSVAYLFVK